MLPPKVTVLIVTYNGYEFTRRCIESVFQNEYPNYEVVLVDNGSSDGTVEKIRGQFGAQVRIVALRSNIGPSAARNRGAAVSQGEFIATLDNDTELDPQWLVNGIGRMLVNPRIGCIQCRLMINRARNRFDYVGDYLGSYGFLMQPVQTGEEDVGQADSEQVILSAKSAGMIVRRDAFERSGGFDDQYFIFVEETDLCLRIWLAGYTVLYVPSSVVFHEFSSSQSALNDTHTRFVRFHGCKNYVATLLKNLETGTLIRVLPVHVAIWIAFAAFNLAKGKPRSALWISQGLWWNVAHLGQTLRKRGEIQRFRVISDAELLRQVGRRDSLRNLLGKTKPIETIPGTFKTHRI
ncbi:MAG: glycosyltransferase family 2 protein [Vulcanimicrobiaceae bacterium]